MRFSEVLGRTLGGLRLGAIEHAPGILMGTGTVGTVLTIISFGKAVLKFQDDLKVHNERLEKLDEIKQRKEAGDESMDIVDIDIPKYRKSVYIDTIKRGVVTFGPSVILGTLSIGSFFAAAGILNKRYLGAMATLSTVIKEKDLLESNVAKEFGAEKLAELKGVIKEPSKIPGDENSEDVSETEGAGDLGYSASPSLFAKFFDESNPNWEKSAESNRFFLQSVENRCNFILRNRGYLFLNEVYRALGMEETQAGQFFGWKFYDDPAVAKEKGAANRVSFGLFDTDSPAKISFINGHERSILLEFNVDKNPILGNIGWEM